MNRVNPSRDTFFLNLRFRFREQKYPIDDASRKDSSELGADGVFQGTLVAIYFAIAIQLTCSLIWATLKISHSRFGKFCFRFGNADQVP